MPNPRIRSIARKLKEEAESFVDYRQIEEETKELGFSTSVRTLRFYVSEGILPPPSRTGKTPVYPREWILNTLLAVYLMKSRFRRGLAEVKAILQNLSEDPEVLADKCTELYEIVSETGNLSPADSSWLVDRFFVTLSGPHRSGETPASAPPQPSEVLITDLLRQLEQERRDEASRLRGPTTRTARARGADGNGGRGPSGPETEPEGRVDRLPRGRSRDEARHLEDVFIRSFEAGFRTLTSVYHPLEKRSYATRSSAREPVIVDEYLRVVEVLKEARCFERELFDRLPLNKSTQFHVWGGRLVQRKLKVSVIGASWSPLRVLVREEAAAHRGTGSEVYRLLDRFVVDPSVFYYIALHSTVTWEPVLCRHPPRGQNYLVALVEYDDEIGWRVHHGFPEQASPLVAILDPESRDDKIERLKRRIASLGELRVRGGFVPVDELAELLGVDDGIVADAVDALTGGQNGFTVTTVRERRILKRERLPAPSTSSRPSRRSLSNKEGEPRA